MRADIIETVKSTAMKYVLNVPGDLSDFLKETVNSKKKTLYIWFLWRVQ